MFSRALSATNKVALDFAVAMLNKANQHEAVQCALGFKGTNTCFRIHSTVVIDIGIPQRASSDSITTYTNRCYRSALQAGSVMLSTSFKGLHRTYKQQAKMLRLIQRKGKENLREKLKQLLFCDLSVKVSHIQRGVVNCTNRSCWLLHAFSLCASSWD